MQRKSLYHRGSFGSAQGRLWCTLPVGTGSQNPRPVSAKNADTRTGHPHRPRLAPKERARTWGTDTGPENGREPLDPSASTAMRAGISTRAFLLHSLRGS
jgi:hypothetical protein